ncbi:LtfC-like domain-containing protein [Rhodococcus sp. BH5]|uniref:LtfC-like domain-containing protein n=1 Tax=Rhodococcus sp. BH5 TaxID=2871702 RepID=UPI0022CD3FDE|nr:hypothetical protein [Rhodococcus sp. BH5]MCZ9634743.1 hypothetical protein [Rhodococcus sp. BH5]
MAGIKPQTEPLIFPTGGDFQWVYHYTEPDGTTPKDFPLGSELYYLIGGETDFVKYPFVIEADAAHIKIESEVADLIPDKRGYRLIFKEDTTPTAETVILFGAVERVEPRDYRS